MCMPHDWPEMLLDFVVELDGVLLQLGDVRIAIDGVHAAGGMPGGAGGKFGTLDQQHVLPAGLGEVIKHAGADHAATDHHDSDIRLHIGSGSLLDCLDQVTGGAPPSAWRRAT